MKRVYWSIADNNNLKYFEMMKHSFRKFHPNDELILFGEEEIKSANDPQIFYRATPYFTKRLMEQGYDEVCKLDSDQLITGSLDSIWEDEYDVAVVNNSNPKEMAMYPVTILNIHPLAYANCGFVAMKSKAFVDYWYNMCYSTLYNGCQMREQDMLNILIFSNNYEVKRLDEGDSFYGLASKGYWQHIMLNDKQELVLMKNAEGNWPDKSKVIKCIHFAGGNAPDKMNYRIRFTEDVIKRIDYLVKE